LPWAYTFLLKPTIWWSRRALPPRPVSKLRRRQSCFDPYVINISQCGN